MKKNYSFLILFVFFSLFKLYAQTPIYQNVLVSDQGTSNGIGTANTSRNVITDNLGNIYVVFSGSSGIRVSKSTNRGLSFLPSIQVSTDNIPAEIEISSNGTIYVVWGIGAIYLSKSTDAGTSFSTPQIVATGNNPHINTNGSKVYILPQNGSTIYYNNTDAIGSFVSSTIGFGWAYSDIFVDSTDGAIYAVADDPIIFLFKSIDGGITFSPVTLSQTIQVYYSSYALSIGPLGKFIFVGGGTISLPGTADGFKIDLSNGNVSPITLQNNTVAEGRCLFADEFGNFVDGYNDGSSLKIRVSNNQGSIWQAPIDVVSGTSHNIAKNRIFNDAVVVYSNAEQVYINVYDGLLVGSATHLNFDGVNDYVNCGNILPTSYTKEAWISINSTAFNNNIISGSDAIGENAFWAPGGRLAAGHNGNWTAVQDANTLAPNTWYHVAVSYDSSTQILNLYKDGILIATANGIPSPIGGNLIHIGCFNPGSNLFQGNIDEVRIWNTARTVEQINGSKNCELQATETGLVAYYKFNQGINAGSNTSLTALIDSSGNNNNGTLTNFALTGTSSNWLAGSVVTTGSTCTTLSTNLFDISSNVVVYPNPTRNAITIDIKELLNASVTILDLNGRVVISENLSETHNTIDLSNLQSGMYLFKIKSSEGETVKKVIKN